MQETDPLKIWKELRKRKIPYVDDTCRMEVEDWAVDELVLTD
jgi:hypothetical protein